ncbi:MAG: hypothetical protein KKF54_01215 [Candidatus Omnitrophica bacterium]|nr:hypothetical protein [Candidatus Omnitrophota bacterium]
MLHGFERHFSFHPSTADRDVFMYSMVFFKNYLSDRSIPVTLSIPT